MSAVSTTSPSAHLDSARLVIVGQGLVGASLALLLAEQGVAVTQIEAQATESTAPASFAERYLALNAFTSETLTRLSALPALDQCAAIRRIHVSRAGEFGHVLVQEPVPGNAVSMQLGTIVPARLLAQRFNQALARQPLVQRIEGKVVTLKQEANQQEANHVQLALADGRTIKADLVIAADGTHSTIRHLAGITATALGTATDTALVFNARFEKAPDGTAYERFTQHGPIAMLPLPEQRMGVVWTLPQAMANEVAKLDNGQRMAQFQQAFGYRLGRLRMISEPSLWPLHRLRADQTVAERVVLIGNAAQTVHPIAAQGFNLGLRDALGLSQWLALHQQFDAKSLAQFANTRAADREETINFSEQLLHITRSEQGIARMLRTPAMAWLAYAPLANRDLVRFGLGFTRTASSTATMTGAHHA